MGLEFVVEFPQINPIRTQLRLDGAYGYTKYVNEGEACYYPSTSTGGEFYPYVGVYLDNGGSSNVTYNGRKLHALDMNLTATTHVPSIRMVISLRLEASLVKRSQNLSEYKGREYAFNVDGSERQHHLFEDTVGQRLDRGRRRGMQHDRGDQEQTPAHRCGCRVYRFLGQSAGAYPASEAG